LKPKGFCHLFKIVSEKINFVIFRSEIDCVVKCKSILGCTSFQYILESQTCQLGSLSNLEEGSETDPDVKKIYIFEQIKGNKTIVLSHLISNPQNVVQV
jgi:hypothetical protein